MSPPSRQAVLRDAGGALAGAALVGAAGVARIPAPSGETPTDTARTSQPTPAVEFDDQPVADAGRRVVVERGVLPDGGFVAIHDGAPTQPIVGSSDYLTPGAHRDVDATFDEEDRVTDRTELSAVLWRDATGDEEFDYAFAPADEPYLVGDEPVADTAVVSVPTPTPESTPTRTPSPTPASSPTPTPTDPPATTTTDADGAVPGFGVVAGLVAVGAGAVAARRGD